MLLNLHVKNLAIIDEVEVDFSEHLNIMSGETGAGKSILIGSINIALGGKVSMDMVRKGAEYALVELTFQVEDAHSIEKLRELDIPVEDGQIIISRRIKNGKSLSKVNGECVTTSILKEIAGVLIDIHGQHEHQSLLYKSKHLEILDRYGGEAVAKWKEKVSEQYKEYTELKRKLVEDEIPEEERLREVSFMQYEKNEIESARLKKGEEEELEVMQRKLSNANTLAEGLSSVYQITGNGNESVSECIGRAVKQLSRLSELDKEVQGMESELLEIEDLFNSFNRQLASYVDELSYEPEELTQIEERLNLIYSMKARYGNSIEEIEAYYVKLQEKLSKYEDYELYIEQLKEKTAKAEQELAESCKELTVLRNKAAKELEKEIKKALEDLNFLDVEFVIAMRELDKFAANGKDEAEFMISTNPGEEVKSLARVASGGELSRIMLAIKSVLAEKDAVDTLIFDEIDTGISGRTAQKVSEKLKKISRTHQVISITHLPQIASMADEHFIIEKSTDGMVTKTNISLLSEEDSVVELARMLGGAKITEAVFASAREMKQLARQV